MTPNVACAQVDKAQFWMWLAPILCAAIGIAIVLCQSVIEKYLQHKHDRRVAKMKEHLETLDSAVLSTKGQTLSAARAMQLESPADSRRVPREPSVSPPGTVSAAAIPPPVAAAPPDPQAAVQREESQVSGLQDDTNNGLPDVAPQLPASMIRDWPEVPTPGNNGQVHCPILPPTRDRGRGEGPSASATERCAEGARQGDTGRDLRHRPETLAA